MNSQQEQNSQFFLMHEKQVNAKGERKTFAAKIENDVMHFGVSTCGKRDQFTKKLGRTIAIGRAEKHPLKTVKIPVDTDTRQLFFEVVKTL